jgi:hypothetical protein
MASVVSPGANVSVPVLTAWSLSLVVAVLSAVRHGLVLGRQKRDGEVPPFA